MELPEDVLHLVREYAKPVFTYFKEYRHALKVIGKTKWTRLKEKLHTEPEVVLPILHDYLDAFIKRNEAYRLWDELDGSIDETSLWYEKNRLHNLKFYTRRREEDVFWTLVRVLYGDGKSYWEVREETMYDC